MPTSLKYRKFPVDDVIVWLLAMKDGQKSGEQQDEPPPLLLEQGGNLKTSCRMLLMRLIIVAINAKITNRFCKKQSRSPSFFVMARMLSLSAREAALMRISILWMISSIRAMMRSIR